MERNPSKETSPASLEVLPETLLLEVVSYLGFVEGHRFLGASKALHGGVRQAIDKQTHQVVLDDDERQRLVLGRPFVTTFWLKSVFRSALRESLLRLDLSGSPLKGEVGGAGTDGFLHVAFAQLGLFPNLQHLGLRGSDDLTDFGLRCLDPRGPHSHTAARASQPNGTSPLVSIDLAFCPGTTYHGTLFLRDVSRFPHLQLIRRQPEWLDGNFETPFGEGLAPGEVHTYYADGSFSFNRDFQSNGFVCQWYPWDENFVGDKLQYNNFQTPMGWPEWTQFCYRPGVCLLRIPPEEEEEDCPSVLVGQYMRCIRAPQERELLEKAKALVPLGTSRLFDKVTHEVLPPDVREQEDGNPHRWVMISRMKVRPLGNQPRESETQPIYVNPLMPPRDLVQACANTCAGIHLYDTGFLARHEDRLNVLLSGDPDEHPDDS